MSKKLTKTINLETQALIITTADEESMTFSLGEYSQDILTHLALHGLSQKLGDSVASKEINTPEAVRETINGVQEKLRAGEWTVTRSSDGAGRTTLLAEALARIAGRSIEEARDVIAGLSDEQKKALRADDHIKAAISAIKAERDAAKASESTLDIGAIFAASEGAEGTPASA